MISSAPDNGGPLPLHELKAMFESAGTLLPQMSLLGIGLAFGLSFVLALAVATLYRKLYPGPSYSFSFFVTLLVTPIVVTMIMMAIGSNVALSIGLVGALSIIRFRTVIKDTRDMAFLFLMIGIGLCCGAGAFKLAVIGCLFVMAVLVGVHWLGRTTGPANEYILVFRQNGAANGGAERALAELVQWRKLHGAADLGNGDGCEYTYRIRLSPTATPEAVLNRLRSVEGLYDSSLISPESQVSI